ncbi:hypothetical protein RJ639_045746 [Escallonia herrerae]|uniref:Non-haem dioxygenase N-terminal domain-containing protein n=1 Tax=Escallonia herrerae TaxID=1293975 RepID=A0AA88W3K2_9ASTE|nr:hypothetical protein RJ639_045746 [Escallonia herrerae]
MAGAFIQPAEVLLSKRVQEMVINGEEPPAPYICREGDATEEDNGSVAIGHGIPSSFLDEIRQVTKEFFGQPMEEKKKYAKTVTEFQFQGYGADPVPEEGQPLDWSDRLFLDVYPEDKQRLKFWPEKPESFRDILKEYTEKMKMVTKLTSKAMAKSLNLEENCFLDQFGEQAPLQATIHNVRGLISF